MHFDNVQPSNWLTSFGLDRLNINTGYLVFRVSKLAMAGYMARNKKCFDSGRRNLAYFSCQLH
jgi:hypothetical protein